ncbi:tetratricopeptide repeat protein [Sphingomonas sp. DT-204]|uniref:SPOR domain-containing protein n=1 Tax=Sphingomonas sp. DT-204 TaxID=3396166 RepID=UPI003F1D769B
MTFRITIAAALAGVTLAGSIAVTAASDTGAPRRAAEQAQIASKALARHKAAQAVTAAEAAVALQPREAGYRTLLGQAYLMAGRFVSAGEALKDALALDPADGAAALHLALAQIGTGDWGGARETLDAHQGSITPADRGLALALAGDPVGAVEILIPAARGPEADAKTRQNLALSLALAGRWSDAKTVAALDVSPAEVDKRIVQWAAFARPSSASDQVAALLGVTPVEDAGQPRQLALGVTSRAVAAVAQVVDPVDAYMPGTGEAPKVAAEASAAPPASEGATSAPAVGISFAPHQEIVQAIPVASAERLHATAAPKPTVVARARPARSFVPAAGSYFVQLGAYENAAVAREKWGGLGRRIAALSSLQPHGMQATVNGASFYRLSVGGFTRADAVRLCADIKRIGGRCFVRGTVGETIASWSRPRHGGGVQMAAR